MKPLGTIKCCKLAEHRNVTSVQHAKKQKQQQHKESNAIHPKIEKRDLGRCAQSFAVLCVTGVMLTEGELRLVDDAFYKAGKMSSRFPLL